MDQELNTGQITIDGKKLELQDYVQEHEQLAKENARLRAGEGVAGKGSGTAGP